MYGHAHTWIHRPMPSRQSFLPATARARRANASNAQIPCLLHEIFFTNCRPTPKEERKKERTHSSCSRVERLCGPERDGRKGAHAQSSCVLTLSLVVWDGSTHTCAVQRDASAIFLSRRFGRPCGPLLHLFVRLWRDFGLLDRSLVCIFN
jgi:hypothetical protein